MRTHNRSEQTIIWKVVLITTSFLLVLISLYMVSGRPTVNENWTIVVSGLCLVWLCTYVISSYGHLRTVYLFSTAYIGLLFIFHFGITLPDAIGWFRAVGYKTGNLAPWLERTGWFTLLALGSIGVGFGFSIKRQSAQNITGKMLWAAKNVNLGFVFWSGIGLLVASAIFLGFGIASVGNLLGYSRNDFFRGVGDTRGLGAFLFVFPGAVICIVIGAQRKGEYIFAFIICLFGLVLVMLSGYRTTALYPLIVGAILWVKTGRRIPTVYAVAGVVTVLILIPAVGKLRTIGAYEKIDINAVQTSIEHSELKNLFKEVGGTAGVAANVFKLVPEDSPYRFGLTYLQAIQRAIPNIGLTQSESDESKARRRSLGNPDIVDELPPAAWITYKVSPEKFKIGQGIGFSGVAEPYLNFGVAGVVGYFLVLGYLLGKLDHINLILYPKLLLFTCASFWPLMRTVRDSYGNFIKPMIFVFIVLIIWWSLTGFMRRKQKRYESVIKRDAVTK